MLGFFVLKKDRARCISMMDDPYKEEGNSDGTTAAE
jgi:hypothetical protein